MTDTETQAASTPAPDATQTPVTEASGADAPTGTAQVADSSPAVTDTDEIASKAKGVGKRIDELTRNWREEQRRNAELMTLLQRMQPQAPEPQQATPAAPKTLADFEYDEPKYQAYLFNEAARHATEAARRELQEQTRRETETRRAQSFAQREQKFAATVDDYLDVTRNPALPITAPMAEAIAESDDGPALAYHLGKNPELAERIAALSPSAAARELGRLEARLAFERDKPKSVQVSQAPPPAPKIAATAPEVSKDPSQMTDEEFRKWRLKSMARYR